MSTAGLPEWLVEQCGRKGIRATQRGIAEAAGTYAPTVKRVLEGRGEPESVKAVAHALGMSLADFSARVGYSNELGPWEPPTEAHHLGTPEREALGVLIRAMARGGQSDAGQAEDQKTHDQVADLDRYRNTPAVTDRAAMSGRDSEGKHIHAEYDQLGEDNQDPGGDDPA